MKREHLSKISALFIVLIATGAFIIPVAATETTKDLSVPYYNQEQDYYCGPAVAQMWIDFHDDYVSQDTLYSYIESHNLEPYPEWYTDPYGLACSVDHYVDDLVAGDHSWSSFNTANLAMAMDIVDRDIPSAVLTFSGDHWSLVKGVTYDDYYGMVNEVYSFRVHIPQLWSNFQIGMDDWSSLFDQVDHPGSSWDNYWVTVQGYWGSKRVGAPDYEAQARNVTLMSDEEDDALLPEDTDFAEFAPVFARQMMDKFGIFQEELEGAEPGEPIFVHSLDERWHDYYLVPFGRDGYITVITTVFIKGDVADFGISYAPDAKTRSAIRPTLEEARKTLAENGYDGDWSARLIYRHCEQALLPTHPLWEFTTDDRDTVYVGYVPWKDQVEIYEELTQKTISG